MGEMNPKNQAHKKQNPLIMEFQISVVSIIEYLFQVKKKHWVSYSYVP